MTERYPDDYQPVTLAGRIGKVVQDYCDKKCPCFCGAMAIQYCTFSNTPANCLYSKE